MASYVPDTTLNIAANTVTNTTIQVRIHTASPGNNGTASRIGTVSADHPASEWTDAAAGVSETTVASAFGVLSTTLETTVTHYSLWDGVNFRGWGDLTTPLVVAAGESASLNAGTVEFRFMRP